MLEMIMIYQCNLAFIILFRLKCSYLYLHNSLIFHTDLIATPDTLWSNINLYLACGNKTFKSINHKSASLPCVLEMVLVNDNYKFKSPLINSSISLLIMRNHISSPCKQMLFYSRTSIYLRALSYLHLRFFSLRDSYLKF